MIILRFFKYVNLKIQQEAIKPIEENVRFVIIAKVDIYS